VVLASLSAAEPQQPAAPMASDAVPSFEVATIKPTDPSDTSRGFHLAGRRIFIENEDLNTLISVAYAIHKKQIVETRQPGSGKTDTTSREYLTWRAFPTFISCKR
jgi:hypothetical protein